MRALVLFAFAPSSALQLALSPQPLPHSIQRPIPHHLPLPHQLARHRPCSMFTEPPPASEGSPEEELDKMVGELSSFQRTLGELSPIAMGATTSSLTLLGVLLSWFVTPSFGRVGTFLSVGAGGMAAREGGQKLKRTRRGALPAQLARLVVQSGLDQLKPAQVRALADRLGVGEEELEGAMVRVYSRYLKASVEVVGTSSTEISSLAALRRGLGMKWNSTEMAHVEACNSLEEEEERAKMYWLSVSLFATSKGKANASTVLEALGEDDRGAQRWVNELSIPIYKRAVAQAVSKYNASETVQVLSTVRSALGMSEGAATEVHNDLYDGQLSMLLAQEPILTEEAIELLGELEAMLQIRAAARRMQMRTLPLYRAEVRAALEKAANEDPSPTAVWGSLALKQQQLKLPSNTARAALIEEARLIASSRLSEASELASAGKRGKAVEQIEAVGRYGNFIGRMLELSGWGGDSKAADLAEQYLGALSVDELDELPDLVNDKMASKPLLDAMLALSAPGLEKAKESFRQSLEAVLADEASGNLAKQGSDLGLPAAVQQKLALEAYYGWLSDLSETVNREALERCEEVRKRLQLQDSSVGELYTKTGIDELVLEAVLQQLFDEDQPSDEAKEFVLMLERLMLARPDVATSLLEG